MTYFELQRTGDWGKHDRPCLEGTQHTEYEEEEK